MNEQKLKSYWNRPGGKFGMLVAMAGLGAIGWYVLPILTAIVWNTINFGIACVTGAVLAYCLSHRKLRMSAFYFYEIVMKRLVGVVIQMDPFIIAEDYIGDMEEEREKMRGEAVKVDAQKERLAMKIQERERQHDKAIAEAKAAKQLGNGLAVATATREIGRCEEYIRQLTPLKDNLQAVGGHLDRIYTNSKYTIQDAKSELEMKRDLYKSVTQGNKALSSALRLFNGDPEKKLLVEQSMEYLKDDIALKLANMKQSTRITTEIMEGIDLENATYEQAGMAKLAALSEDGNFKLERSPDPLVMPVKAQATGYRNLLD